MKKRTVRIRNTEIGAGRPKICIPLVAREETELSRALERLSRTPYDLVEWRADFYRQAEDAGRMERAMEQIRRQIGEKPLLFTFRTGEEGGNRRISRELYLELNERAAKSGLADLVDVEINRGEETARRLIWTIQSENCRVLGSFHDFHGTPEVKKMTGILCGMQGLGMDITKLAVMPGSRKDVLELLQAAVLMEEELGDRPCVTMAMGSLGAVSRMIGSFTGSAITFGTAGASSAPGQVPAEALDQVLRILSESIEEK